MEIWQLPKCDKELDEKICGECRGKGTIEIQQDYTYYSANSICPKCQGKGKLDWIEQIVGVKPPEPVFDISSCMSYHTHSYCHAPIYTCRPLNQCASMGSHVHSAGPYYGCSIPVSEHNHSKIDNSKKEFFE